MYIGMGRHQMPGDVWWRSWRTPPPQRCATDPVNSATATGTGYWHTYTDPQSGKKFPVWEGHYTYPGTSLTFVPTFAGGMFEGLMANLVVPETTLGSAQLRPRRPALGPGPGEVRDPGARLPGMGDVAVLTADDTGGYGGFGVEGLAFGTGSPLAWCTTCATENTVSPHASAIALPVLPQDALRESGGATEPVSRDLHLGRRVLRRGQPGDG